MDFTVRLRGQDVAEVGYVCSCGCKPRARYRQGAQEAGHEHCCCGRVHFVGSDALGQLQAYLRERKAAGEDTDREYRLFQGELQAPWGGPLPVAYGIPQER